MKLQTVLCGPILFAIGSIAILAPRSETKAPYQLPGAKAITHQYVVMLHENHTIADHFENIGMDLSSSEAVDFFRPLDLINSYSCDITNASIMHDIIRHDPWVKHVEHNYHATRVQHEDSNMTIVEPPFEDSRAPHFLQRRNEWRNMWMPHAYWFQAQLAAGRKLDLPLSEKDNDNTWEMDRAGAGVNIYVLDSGIRFTHSTLAHTGGTNFGGLADTDKSPYCDETMADSDGHGTHVAGIMVRGGYGIAKSAKVINVKIWGKGENTRDIGQAILDVTAEHKKFLKKSPFQGWKGSVINLSGTASDRDSPSFEAICQAAFDAGIPLAVAAGNKDQDVKTVTPCRYSSTICVGASDINYRKWVSSNYGKKLDVIAPGVNIPSAWGKNNDHEMKTTSGTSMATPFVAGIMAIFVGWEGYTLNTNTAKTYSRLRANLLDGIVVGFPQNPSDIRTPRKFVNTGIGHPDRGGHPYYGIGHDELKKKAENPAPHIAMPTASEVDDFQGPDMTATDITPDPPAPTSNEPVDDIGDQTGLYCTNNSLEDGDGICTCNIDTYTTTITPVGGPGNDCPTSISLPPQPTKTFADSQAITTSTKAVSAKAFSTKAIVSHAPTTTPKPSSLYCSNPSLEDGDGLCTCNQGAITTTITPAGGPGNDCPKTLS